MKYLKQTFIILGITLIAELLSALIPLPLPASIYGMIILFACLMSGLIKLDQVEEAGQFLIAIMPVMFVAPAAGLITSWPDLKPHIWAWLAIIIFTTIFIMVITAKTAQFMTRNKSEAKQADQANEVEEVINQ
ncbi:murein hydrolase regulator LrgA [Aerococcus urinaehominis]|uniref:Murein hydrolase regulator LrgA n=1 Tax=Aerococcus urinaehominis TaxID=128944 RepID=A0A0X8FL54_9LACT|nr:CidA/LrgA family protein [Aerococcus urinaehominis]AMB99314.1 murein hydrolase regulator LrgA [Aerococcus urinaehominis]SDM19950.1 holin-like protein [Aerococcus urinaehominis]